MGLPTRARLVIWAVCALAVALVLTVRVGWSGEGFGDTGVLLVLCAVVLAAWTWPLIVYRGHQSEAVHADEGLLLVSLLLLPPQGVLVVVAVAAVVGQVVHRRPLVKAAFNWAQVMVAVSLAVMVTRTPWLAPAGVLAFFVVSSVLIAGIIAVTSATSFRAALLDGAELRLLVLAVGCVVTGPVGLAARVHPWAIVVLPPLYLCVRWVLAGRFDARHDRDRMLGLFDATLAVHRPVAVADVRTELTTVAGQLLRSPQVRLSEQGPREGETGSRVDVEGAVEWLSVAGRPHAEPMDAADQRLLDALAAVGQSALSHAEMYARTQRQRDELTAIMGGLAEGVVAFDASGEPIYVNPAGAGLLATDEQLRAGEVQAARESLVAAARRCLKTAAAVSDEAAIFLRFDGAVFPASYTCAPILEAGEAVGAVLVFRDVSERIAAERELTHNAFHDQLTGLPNRRLFLDRLDQALLRGERSSTTSAVLLADIDRFKTFNDNLGQQAGDELIQEIARRIALVTGPDTIARFGGDEFTVLLEGLGSEDEAHLTASLIGDQLTAPIRLSEGRDVVASVSIGIATTAGRPTADDVLHDADVAMSQAKAAGLGGVHVYDAAAMLSRSAHRFDLEADLREAIAGDVLEVYYQPKMDLSSGEMHDVEALIRWPDPEQGLRMPGEFIPVAEESGLILPLGRFVLTQASKQAHLWAEIGAQVSVAVNLSARQFQDHGLIGQIEDALRISELPPDRLCLEITESLAMQDLELTVRTLTKLKDLGVELAIDDFGTGHSSLNYLKRFPVDEVKIDRSFVTNLAHSKVDRAIVSAIVGLADALEIRTVVEGIEDLAQLDWVRELGCSLAQGYHVSRPKTAAQVTPMLVGAGLIPMPRPDGSVIDLTKLERRA